MDYDSLEARIAQLEDVESIKKLKARYWFACDTRDTQALRACFCRDNLLIDFGFIGQFTDAEAFIKTFESLACHTSQIDMHLGCAPEIEIQNNRLATGRWRMRFQLLDTQKKLVQLMHGFYEDSYEKIGQHWKIRTTRYTIQSNVFINAAQDTLRLLEMGDTPGLVNQ